MDETQVMTRRARPDEYVAVGELRVTAYQALGLLPEGSGYNGVRRLRLCTQPAMRVAQRLYETTGFSRTPDLDFQPVPGLTLRAYELALPRIRG
jgi:hypothetical protein